MLTITESDRIGSSMVSCYRDRTSEFRSLSERLKKKSDGLTAAGTHDAAATTTTKTRENESPAADDADASRSDFNRKASSIGLAIHDTSRKIARLAKRNEDLLFSREFLPFFFSIKLCIFQVAIHIHLDAQF